MRQTLFFIPDEIAGVPVFGFGLLLLLWTVFSVGFVIWLVRRQGFSADTRGHLPMLVLIGAAIVFLLPVLAAAGEGRGLPVRGYGVMFLIGVVSGVLLAARRARRTGMDPDLIFSLAFWLFASGIVGARLFHVIEYWEQSYRQTDKQGAFDLGETLKTVLNIPAGGLVVYGSLFASLVVLVGFIRKHKLPGLALVDLIAPCMVLGLAFGRIGCLLNGCCFGGVCDLPWAITFPEGSPPYQQQLQRGLHYGIQVGARPAVPGQLSEGSEWAAPVAKGERVLLPYVDWTSDEVADAGFRVGQRIVRIDAIDEPTAQDVWHVLIDRAASPHPVVVVTEDAAREKPLHRVTRPARTLPVQPTQIYSALNALLLFVLLMAYYPFRSRDGVVFGLLITLYPITRFGIEIIRTDEAAMFGTGFSISQIVSLLLLIGVVGYWIVVFRQPKGQLWKASSSNH